MTTERYPSFNTHIYLSIKESACRIAQLRAHVNRFFQTLVACLFEATRCCAPCDKRSGIPIPAIR